MPEIKLIPLDQIPWEECFAFQPRDKMSEEHINQLYELVSESDEERQQNGLPLLTDLFPPLVVFTKGGLTDLFYLADGFHRFEALSRAHRDAWLCEVHVVDDPKSAAEDHSFIANTKHGLRRDAATCQRIFRKIRAKYPDLQMYGKDGIEGKTGLSRGFLHIQLKRLREEGNPDSHKGYKARAEASSNPSNPSPPADTSRVERIDEKTNPNCEPLANLDEPPVTEDIVEAQVQKPRGGKMTDKLGRSVPPGLRPKFNHSSVAEFVRKCGMFVAELDELAGKPGWEYLDVAAQGRAVKTIQAAIKAAEYYTECPRCDMDKSCKLCRGAGFITSLQHARLDDREKAGLKD